MKQAGVRFLTVYRFFSINYLIFVLSFFQYDIVLTAIHYIKKLSQIRSEEL